MSKGPKNRFTEKQVARALIQSGGQHTIAADLLACTPNTIYRYIQYSVALQKLQTDIVERNLDTAETALFDCIAERQVSAITFYLRTRGKHRGYTERTEITGNEGNAIEVDYKSALLERVEKIINRRGDKGTAKQLECGTDSSNNIRLELLGEGESTRTD